MEILNPKDFRDATAEDLQDMKVGDFAYFGIPGNDVVMTAKIREIRNHDPYVCVEFYDGEKEWITLAKDKFSYYPTKPHVLLKHKGIDKAKKLEDLTKGLKSEIFRVVKLLKPQDFEALYQSDIDYILENRKSFAVSESANDLISELNNLQEAYEIPQDLVLKTLAELSELLEEKALTKRRICRILAMLKPVTKSQIKSALQSFDVFLEVANKANFEIPSTADLIEHLKTLV